MATLKTLRIKTGTCKRVLKELHSYEKEVDREAAKTAHMKEKGADPYDLKQQILSLSRLSFCGLGECSSRKRLEAPLIDLQGMLAELEQSGQEGDGIREAKTAVKDVEALFETPAL